MAIRSSVSADISKHVVWINSTDLKSSIKAAKIHDILIRDFGYDNGFCLQESSRGEGISVCVCSRSTVRQMAEDYADAKRQERDEPTTKAHEDSANQWHSEFY